MNTIFLNWACHCAYDTCLALSNLGHQVHVINLPESAQDGIDEPFIHELTRQIKETQCDVVFSINYYPTVSICCEKVSCPYVSWIYDNPYLYVYDKTASNPCNHIFTFDSHMASQLQSRGLDHVYYAPMAANVKRLTSYTIDQNIRNKYTCDISFVGSLYNESHNFYDRLIGKAQNPYLQGFLEGLLEAQRKVYGYNFLAESLTPEILSIIRQYMPYPVSEGSFIREEEVYADFYLARKLAWQERIELLYTLGEFFHTRLYTHNDIQLGKVENCGIIDYNDEMPLLFRCSNINLNISLRSIKNGIPLRAMDILGCGGFLLTNFQEDFLRHFDEDKHFVCYSSPQEAVEKADFYLKHDELRTQIRKNVLELMTREHTFEIRLKQMLEGFS